MFLTLKMEWDVREGSTNPSTGTKIGPGRFKIERIPHPNGKKNVNWLVLEGTKTGAAEGFWRQFEDEPDDSNMKVVIEE